MSVKTSIGWCDTTCNPVKGLCQGGCWYCYYSGKRGIARRFKQDPELRLDLSVFDKLTKAPKKVFLCSTNDYWGDWIPDEWREAIREKTQGYPQHTFQILTKQGQNLIRYSPYPDNWWVGVTIVGGGFTYPYLLELGDGLGWLTKTEARVRYISFEPLLYEPTPYALYRLAEAGGLGLVNLVIIGRLTGYGHKYDPKMKWIDDIVAACDKVGIPIFLKDNLQPLVDKVFKGASNYSSPIPTPDNKLRQEFPK